MCGLLHFVWPSAFICFFFMFKKCKINHGCKSFSSLDLWSDDLHATDLRTRFSCPELPVSLIRRHLDTRTIRVTRAYWSSSCGDSTGPRAQATPAKRIGRMRLMIFLPMTKHPHSKQYWIFQVYKGPVIIYHLGGGGAEDLLGGDYLIFRRTEGGISRNLQPKMGGYH